jgi:hypothetical protein
LDTLSAEVMCQLGQLWKLETYVYERLQQLSARCAGGLRPEASRTFTRCLGLGGLMLQLNLALPMPESRRFTLQSWPAEARHLGGVAELLVARYERLAREPSAAGAVAQVAWSNARGAQALAAQLLQEEQASLRRCA